MNFENIKRPTCTARVLVRLVVEEDFQADTFTFAVELRQAGGARTRAGDMNGLVVPRTRPTLTIDVSSRGER